MKFFTVAAPNPEGNVPAVKLTKETLNAIAAAYPDLHKRECSFDFMWVCFLRLDMNSGGSHHHDQCWDFVEVIRDELGCEW
ncbi:uncharacterized protein BCR38DRAFT_422452 [Pseudomassariella vexata]|uniref:Uncharacterized protein n=1 Tax=Pseudomassariella vexata TaxID=1141098 RepID=A0A1Y2E9Z6_9PEZI|nr:uncharacterized protein BCR38DRAFT_422452 [Pseudomassariella vexata]ORY68217.1 hypothetical protein BCR38DRAFT_422452 [Pseudomassariella vexata]